MKITIERKEKIEIEVNLPAFRKNLFHFYKIEENKTTTVFESYQSYSIDVREFIMQYTFEYETITEQEFNEVYNQVKSKL